MPGSPKKRERKINAVAFLDDEQAIERICGALREGKTLVDVCRAFNLHYGTVNAWIEAVESRRIRYDQALSVRKQHHEEAVIRELFNFLNVDITEAFGIEETVDKDGKVTERRRVFKELEDIPENVRKFIAGIEFEELFVGSGKDKYQVGRTVKIKFLDKTKNMELMMKHLKMLVEKHELGVDESIERIVAESWKRKDEANRDPETKHVEQARKVN